MPEKCSMCRASAWADNFPSALPMGLHIGDSFSEGQELS